MGSLYRNLSKEDLQIKRHVQAIWGNKTNSILRRLESNPIPTTACYHCQRRDQTFPNTIYYCNVCVQTLAKANGAKVWQRIISSNKLMFRRCPMCLSKRTTFFQVAVRLCKHCMDRSVSRARKQGEILGAPNQRKKKFQRTPLQEMYRQAGYGR